MGHQSDWIQGLSVIKALLLSSGSVYAWDDDSDVVKKSKTLYGGCNFIHPTDYDWDTIQELILSPGIPSTFPTPHWIVTLARKHNCTIKSDVQVFLETIIGSSEGRCSSTTNLVPKIICVTGTNGKSTTTSLIDHVLNVSGIETEVGGNIGFPVLEMKPGRRAYVLELSSFQIELTDSLKVDAGVLLNITPDHIDRHGNMNNYIEVKEKLVLQSELAVITCDSKVMQNTLKNLFKRSPVSVSSLRVLKKGVSVVGDSVYENGIHVAVLKLQVNVVTNAENIGSAYAVCREVFGLDGVQIVKAMESFRGLSHRNEIIGKFRNILFVNDSKSTNAAASEKTLVSWENIYWIVGGRSKEEGVEPLCKDPAKLRKIRNAFLIGESRDRFDCSFHGILPAEKCYDLYEAFEKATLKALKDESDVTILLSPACSSFDQWKNFEERGNAFRGLVSAFGTLEEQT